MELTVATVVKLLIVAFVLVETGKLNCFILLLYVRFIFLNF